MITVHGRANSLNVQAVMWAIAELDLPHRRLDVGLNFGGTDTAAFAAMNPNRLIPVIEHDGLILFESGAILRYLAGRFGRAPFWPEDAAGRAPIDVWAEWSKVTLGAAFMAVFVARVRTPADRRDPAAFDRACRELARLMGILDARLREGGPWVMGADFTLADIVAGHMLYRYHSMDIPRADLPRLAAYYERLTRRPAYARHVMIDYAPLYAPGA